MKLCTAALEGRNRSPSKVEQSTSSEIRQNTSFDLDCPTSTIHNVDMHEPICLEDKNSSFISCDLSLDIDDEFVSESETPIKATIKI